MFKLYVLSLATGISLFLVGSLATAMIARWWPYFEFSFWPGLGVGALLGFLICGLLALAERES